ncbi:MAG: peptide-methionine (S)-S-oxide reductase MsrA [Nitrospinae bacterium]|jgi:peptide-methionine (S)-S-oxide reductase|nr:peptide-methionine (S)-S-oxide reductase MsrA [Nitrospinota bacterium]MDA1109622.1 peptide-methionine (S)-S-oxide reductase MsrA [Nitrospinota bacterium]
METATFGAGCFWGVELNFSNIDGVTATSVGYCGGTAPNPTYEMVCTGQSGHAEVVQLEFDASKVTYETLLEAFWNLHDPTTLNRQGPDTGTQYRSAIFFHNSAQETTARESKEKLQQSGKFSRDIVTEIVAAPQYYRAEDYHQKYLEKRGMKNCH